jgi:pheromone shutdown protein TraB
MLEIINSVESATNQTAKKRNWCGIIGFGLGVAALIILAIMVNQASKPRMSQEEYATHLFLGAAGNQSSQGAILADAYSSASTALTFLAVEGILLVVGLILSIIGLFFKPRTLAVIGLLIPIVIVAGFFIIGFSGGFD